MAQRKTKQTEIPATVADVANAPTVVADMATAPKAKPVAQQEAQEKAVQEDMQVGSPQRAYNQRKTLPMDMQV